MSTEFISFQPPPGSSISSYERTASPNAQPSSIPSLFLEAMSIREQVFVHEQSVPLENELDADDSRSFHWIVYASVSSRSEVPNPPPDELPLSKEISQSTAQRVAVGTIRLVPPPHIPHDDTRLGGVESSGDDEPRHQTSPHNPHNEPFIKLGRLAVLRDFRGLGLAKLLLETALDWAGTHGSDISPHGNAVETEAKILDAGNQHSEEWKGLVLVHAQTYLENLYRRWGFVKDETMGTWNEEGIDHIGMWRRISVKVR